MGETERRRRRLRTSSSATVPADPAAAAPPADETAPEVTAAPAADTAPILDPVEDSAPAADRTPRAGYPARPLRPLGVPPTSGAGAGNSTRPTSGAGAGNGDDREAERGLRGLVGSGSSQVSVGAALRARDAARPTEAHLADAEENLVIVRRNWQPREDLPHNR